MTTPEGAVKTAICYYLLTQKGKVRIFWINASTGIYDPSRGIFRANKSPFQIKGVADILGMLSNGRFLAIEVKSKKGRLSPEQKIFLEEINAGGGIGILARSVEDVECALKEIDLL
jgi:hypothetical protein